jgi:AraC family transcriptional regulator of adaptative response / DNA-3-methyladenine glycosylase II
VERADARGYARTVALPTGPATVTVGAVRGRNELSLRVVGAPATALLPLTSRVRRVFDLASDPATIGAALRGDPLLGPLVRRRPGLRIPGAWDAFECAVRAVVGQQVSLAAGRTLVTRLVARVGPRLARPMDGLTQLFPSPEALATADLRGLGLVPARARTLAALARAVADGRLVLDGPADEVRAALLGLPGVGEWTAEYVALRALGEPDAFPAADLVLRRVAGEGRALTPRALAERAEAWRPWRGYAAVHLWETAASRRLSPRPSRREEGD